MNYDFNDINNNFERIIPNMRTYFIRSRRDSYYQNEFIKSIDILKKWHKELEDVFFENKSVAKREEMVALFRTSTVESNNLYYMDKLVLCPKARQFLPIMIFDYISHYSKTVFNKFNTLEKEYKKKKSEQKANITITKKESFVNKWESEADELIRKYLFQAKAPTYLEDSCCKKGSLANYFSRHLQLRINRCFIHISSFLKIMSLPICNESDKLFCLYWYYNNFKNNADMFFLSDEQSKLNIFKFVKNKGNNFDNFILAMDVDDLCEKQDKDNFNQIYNKMLSILDHVMESINNIERLNDITENADFIENFIRFKRKKVKNNKETGKSLDKEFKMPNSFSNRYDYFCGKYVYKFLIDNDREFDLVKLFKFTPVAKEVSIAETEGNQITKLLTIKDIDFTFDDIEYMQLAEKLFYNRYPWYYPLYSLVLQEEKLYYMTGSISVRKGSVFIKSNRINCNISQIKTEYNQVLFLDSLKFIFDRCPKLKNSLWALYVLSYFIVYKGYLEAYYDEDIPEDS